MGPLDSGGFSNEFSDRLGGRLLDARTIVISEAVSPEIGGSITQQLAVLDAESDDPIRVVLSNVPGGDVEAALSIYDFIRSVSAPVTMLAGGRISGAGLVVFVGAASERRIALPHVLFRLDEPRQGGEEGSASDLARKAEEAQDIRRRVTAILAHATGQTEKQVGEDRGRRRSFDAEEALEYGLIDRVVESRDASIE